MIDSAEIVGFVEIKVGSFDVRVPLRLAPPEVDDRPLAAFEVEGDRYAIIVREQSRDAAMMEAVEQASVEALRPLVHDRIAAVLLLRRFELSDACEDRVDTATVKRAQRWLSIKAAVDLAVNDGSFQLLKSTWCGNTRRGKRTGRSGKRCRQLRARRIDAKALIEALSLIDQSPHG